MSVHPTTADKVRSLRHHPGPRIRITKGQAQAIRSGTWRRARRQDR